MQVGLGLRVDDPVLEGHKIIEYVGEYILEAEYSRRRQKTLRTDGYYFAALFDQQFTKKSTRSLYLDATNFGNLSRFANHSCRPTCALELWYIESKPRLFIVALGAMKKGEYVTFKYMDHTWGIECLCGYCDGTMRLHRKR